MKNNRIGVNENWNNDDRYDRSIRNRGHWDVFPTAAGYRPTKTGDDKSDEREMFEVERRVSTATTSQLIHILFDGDGHLANANYPIHGVKAKVREEELAAKELRRRAESGDEVAMGYFSRIFPKVRDGVKVYGDDPRVERANRVLGRLGVRESVCGFPSVRQMIVESALRSLNEDDDYYGLDYENAINEPSNFDRIPTGELKSASFSAKLVRFGGEEMTASEAKAELRRQYGEFMDSEENNDIPADELTDWYRDLYDKLKTARDGDDIPSYFDYAEQKSNAYRSWVDAVNKRWNAGGLKESVDFGGEDEEYSGERIRGVSFRTFAGGKMHFEFTIPDGADDELVSDVENMAKRPLRRGARVDPYFHELRRLASMGVEVVQVYERPDGEVETKRI